MKIMGIINTTPDSFSDGGEFLETSKVKDYLDLANTLKVDYVDIGGESTRPGSVRIDYNEEFSRISPAVKLANEYKENNKASFKISIDTYKSKVVEKLLEENYKIDMVNDISGMTFDKKIADIVAENNLEIVIMHIKGTPETMQISPYYDDVVKDVKEFLSRQIDYALSKGIKEENIWLDPGIGFGKRQEDNLTLLQRIEEFKELGFKLLLGVSRKSFIGHFFNEIKTFPKDRDSGTIATTLYFFQKNIDMVRVHNILDNIQALKIYKVLTNAI